MIVILPGLTTRFTLYAGCRCYSSATGTPYAVEKIPQEDFEDYGYLVENETNAYQVTAARQTPRVVRLKDTFVSSKNEACLVLERAVGLFVS